MLWGLNVGLKGFECGFEFGLKGFELGLSGFPSPVRAAYHRIGREPYLCRLFLLLSPSPHAGGVRRRGGVRVSNVPQGLYPVLGYAALSGLGFTIPCQCSVKM